MQSFCDVSWRITVEELDAQIEASTAWLWHCGPMRALLAHVGRRAPPTLRIACAERLLEDFERRLSGDVWSLPSLEDPMELVEYISGCGWAIAQDVASRFDEAWWLAAVARHTHPRPGRKAATRGTAERVALILLAVQHAVEVLAGQSPNIAQELADQAYSITIQYLPNWLWTHSPPHSSQRVLAMAMIGTELLMRNHRRAYDRIIPVARELRDHHALARLIPILLDSDAVDATTIGAVCRLRDERGLYERQLHDDDRA